MDRKTNRTTEICTQGVVGIVALNQGGSQRRAGRKPLGAAAPLSPHCSSLHRDRNKHLPSLYMYISHSILTGVAFFVFMRVGALCAVRERTRRVLVIFPCFSDL